VYRECDSVDRQTHRREWPTDRRPGDGSECVQIEWWSASPERKRGKWNLKRALVVRRCKRVHVLIDLVIIPYRLQFDAVVFSVAAGGEPQCREPRGIET
jgi:hypothetical protein